ncbi:MAG TPA: iron-sulfur cluster insertion protein ErpA [Ktedonobacteraceae bacterium]|jgi:iron-sulfur cluster assembly accessory protein|nr:iron-sulfur cluster insertion protein ErpA [Ktedonobacteraceae bacterium]
MIEQSQQSAVETSIMTITPAAADKVRELLKQENDPGLALRIFVAGGGCSGLQYGMTLDEAQDGDTTISQGDFNVLVDEMSLSYINGSQVDYVDSLMGAGFTVNNPNAVSSCGCGHSFKTAEGGGEAQSCGCGH